MLQEGVMEGGCQGAEGVSKGVPAGNCKEEVSQDGKAWGAMGR